MQTIEIKPDVMDELCRKAQEMGKSITDVVDDMLRTILTDTSEEKPVIMKCSKCRQEVEFEISYTEGYCNQCESVVFIDKE